MNAPRRSVATASVALAVLTAGLTLAFVQAAPHSGAATVRVQLAPDVSLSPTSAFRVGTDVPYFTADRPGASDIPRVHPLLTPERDAVHAA